MNLKQIVLDIETTGINKNDNYYLGHKIIEIGAIEILNNKITSNRFHKYINPNRMIDIESFKIHGISNNFLKEKPKFCDIVDDFINFIYKSNLIIHNAKFDTDFINYELRNINYKIKNIKNICNIIDTLLIAKKRFPNKKNNLDSLCIRYNIDISNRKLHGALIDAELLSKVYLFLNKYQSGILINNKNLDNNYNTFKFNNFLNKKLLNLKVIKPNKKEINNNKNFINFIKYKLFKSNSN